MEYALPRDVIGRQVQDLQGRKLLVVEHKYLLDHRDPPISDGIASQVDIRELGSDNSLEESLCTLSCDLVVLEVDVPDVLVDLYISLQRRPDRRLDEVLPKIQRHQIQGIEKKVLSSLSLDQVLGDLEVL